MSPRPRSRKQNATVTNIAKRREVVIAWEVHMATGETDILAIAKRFQIARTFVKRWVSRWESGSDLDDMNMYKCMDAAIAENGGRVRY